MNDSHVIPDSAVESWEASAHPDSIIGRLRDDRKSMTGQVIPEAAVIWHDGIVSIRSGDAVADAIYNMERASSDYTMPQHFTLNGDGTITRG